jgi:hypothetical protein
VQEASWFGVLLSGWKLPWLVRLCSSPCGRQFASGEPGVVVLDRRTYLFFKQNKQEFRRWCAAAAVQTM